MITMIKTPIPTDSTPKGPYPQPFPSPLLIVMGVISCFIATAAFIASLTQINTQWPYFLVPSCIGFLPTILYMFAQRHRKSDTSGRIFMPSDYIVWSFVLVTLWMVIFFINILFCIESGGAPGVIMATILSGLEWIILLFISLECVHEIYRAENINTSDPEHPSALADAHNEPPNNVPVSKSQPRLIFLISFILCTLALVFSVSPSISCIVNIIGYVITGPHHIAIFVSMIRPHSPTSRFYQPSSVPFALFLVALWSCIFISDIVGLEELFQAIISGLFAAVECIIVSHFAIRSVLDSFAEDQIKI